MRVQGVSSRFTQPFGWSEHGTNKQRQVSAGTRTLLRNWQESNQKRWLNMRVRWRDIHIV
jgi:hypothetical protein